MYTSLMLVQMLLVATEFVLVVATLGLLIWIWMVGQHFHVPFVPTRTSTMKATLDALKLDNVGTFYDLGSGDGRVVIAALNKFPHLRGVGIELRRGFVLMSKLSARLRGVGTRADFRTDDIFTSNLSDATRVYAFLSNPMMARLEPKLDQELRGARFISLGFPLPHRKPDEIIELQTNSKYYKRLFVYEYPAEPTG